MPELITLTRAVANTAKANELGFQMEPLPDGEPEDFPLDLQYNTEGKLLGPWLNVQTDFTTKQPLCKRPAWQDVIKGQFEIGKNGVYYLHNWAKLDGDAPVANLEIGIAHV